MCECVGMHMHAHTTNNLKSTSLGIENETAGFVLCCPWAAVDWPAPLEAIVVQRCGSCVPVIPPGSQASRVTGPYLHVSVEEASCHQFLHRKMGPLG